MLTVVNYKIIQISKGERIMIQIRNYSEEDLIFLTNNYHIMSVKDLADKLNKSTGSVSNAVRKLGLIKQVHKPWTDTEIQYLIDNYIEMTSEEIAKHLGRTIHSINAQRDKLGLVRHEAWTDDEIKFLKDNYQTMEHLEIGKVLHRTDSAVRAKCFDLDLYKKEKPWEEWECDFVRDNYRDMSKSEIAEILNRSCDAIQCRASKLGIKKSPYYCNYHFFDIINTEEKAYWLGFLMADGWIGKRKNINSGIVGVEIQYNDIEHLRKFNKALQGNYHITERWRTSDFIKAGRSHSCCLRIFSNIMYDALIQYGFTHNKSFEAQIPNLPFNLQRHFLRGFFDGNGCFGLSKTRLWVSFSTASLTMKNDLIMLLKQFDIQIGNYSETTENNVIVYRPEVTNMNHKLKLLSIMYDDCTIYLNRKYKKYLKAKEYFTTT